MLASTGRQNPPPRFRKPHLGPSRAGNSRRRPVRSKPSNGVWRAVGATDETDYHRAVALTDLTILRRLGRAAELVLVVAAAAAGLAWALPAAAIGLALGYVVLATLYFPRMYSPWPVVLAVVACCTAVSYLDATRDLGIGYRYIPAVLPFLLLMFVFSSIVHRSPRLEG